MSYPLRMNMELYNRIYNLCIFKRKGLMKEIFARFDDVIFAKYNNDCGGEYLIYFAFKDKPDLAVLPFPKDIIGEIEKYAEKTYYIERIYKFCSCVDDCEESLRKLFRIKTRDDIRTIIGDLVVHLDKDECETYLSNESFAFNPYKIQ